MSARQTHLCTIHLLMMTIRSVSTWYIHTYTARDIPVCGMGAVYGLYKSVIGLTLSSKVGYKVYRL